MNIVFSQTKIRILFVGIKRILKTETLAMCIRKDIIYLSRSIKLFGQEFGTPIVSYEFVSVFVKMNTSGLLVVIDISEVQETHPTFFSNGILPTVHYVDLFPERIVQKMVVIHIVFTCSCISVNEK